MKYIFFIFLSIQAFSMDDGEKFSAQLLKVHGTNVITLNRGLEDGIEKGDYIRVEHSEDGFISRAICVQTELMMSYWRLVKVGNGRRLLPNTEFQITVIPQSKLPPHLAGLAKNTQLIPVAQPAFGTTQPQTQNQQLATAQTMLQDLNVNSLKRDFQSINVNLFASPIQFQSLNDTKNITYGFQIGNANAKRYELSTNYAYSKSSTFDPFQDVRVDTSSYDAGLKFDINKFWKDFSYFMLLNFQRQKTGTIFPVRLRITGGVTGIKYDFYESDIIKDLSISYIPLLEYQVAEYFGFDEMTYEQILVQETTNKVRHSLRFKFKFQPTPYLSVSNTLYWKPFHDVPNKQIDFVDTDTSNTLNISYNLNANISLSYQNLYTWDIRQKRLYQQPSSNMSHTFTVGVAFTL